MKRFVLVAALLLTTITTFAQNGKSIYQKYSDTEGVSAVYISPAMFRLIGKIPDLQIEGEDVNLAPIIKSLTGLYLIDSENPAINASLKADAEQFVMKGNYELLMEAKDSGETMRLFTVGTETIVNGFVMIADEGDETTFIFLDGKMNREELEKVIAESTKK
ncbi:MAG: DUF4252 domain-containing protein [Bacteroidales bacterium]|nr:DUF4252 domain-containing protein [Bacteroidales bacterium]